MTVRPVGSLTAGLLGVVGAFAIGCGNDSTLLSDTQAAGLKDTLEQVRGAVDARDCLAANARLKELKGDVGNLPGTVDRELRVRLREEINGKLAPRVEDECNDDKTETVPTTTTPAPTGPTGSTAPEPDETGTTETTPPPDTGTTGTVPPPAPEVPDTTPAPGVPDPGAPEDSGGFGDESGQTP